MDVSSAADNCRKMDTNQESTISAPGNKTWTYHYNDLGQPTSVDIPNGMHGPIDSSALPRAAIASRGINSRL